MYTVCPLLPEQLERFAHLTFPSLRNAFRDHPQYVSVGASQSGIPVGLVTAELKPEHIADVRSIVVTREHRRKGVATLLLRTIEQALLGHGCSAASVLCTSTTHPHPGIDDLLRKNGWPVLEARGILCKTNYPLISLAPWMKCRPLPSGYDYQLVSELTEQERSRIIQAQVEQPWFPDVLNPFKDEPAIEKDTSLALRYGDAVVGWCVFHQVSESATQCKSLFVRQELRNRGLAITLLVRAIELHSNLRRQTFVFDVAFDKVKMIRFVERRMLPYLQSVWTVSRSTKSLVTERAAVEAECERVSV